MQKIISSHIIVTVLLLSVVFKPYLFAEELITIIYTGSANGVLESCQCPGNPYGGLVNRKVVVDSLLDIYPHAIVLDVGDFLPFKSDSLKSLYILRALELCSIDAIAPGDQDFTLGPAFLLNYNLPFVSASFENISGIKDSFRNIY